MNVVFLDRDGTVIVDPPDERVDREDKIELFPDTLAAMDYLAEHNFAVIFITNQAGIAEGRINNRDFERIHNKVLEMLAPTGIKTLKTYMCPHGPDDGCSCRKPKPTLILQAAKEFDIDLPNTFMMGDRQSDIMAGVAAGTKTILVKTANVPVTSVQANFTATTLLDAVKYVAANTGPIKKEAS
jgi:D-glycero-D-manno-heptose 1,7-bisphosphate phosphatase